MLIMTDKTKQVYDLIAQKVSTNELMQGLSGVLGFPWTIVADTGALFTHYGPMLRDIFTIYGKEADYLNISSSVIEASKAELVTDLVVDKLLGQIPFAGVAFNVMCAKAMTWRLGLLFAMLAKQEGAITDESAKAAMKKIRSSFPQKNMLTFTAPGIEAVEKLLNPNGTAFEGNNSPFYAI